MKKILLQLLLVITLSSCGSTKTNREVQDWIKSQNFTIVKPNTWRPVKHHGYVGYTPLNKESKYYNNLVSIFQFKLKEKPNFKEFSMKSAKEVKKYKKVSSEEILEEQNKLGNTLVHSYESIHNGMNYKHYTVYFENNEDFYFYTYSSLKEDYEKYFKEAMSILNSVRFK
ncbi:hypothetical protein [Tenacibaculum sp. 190524A05c]|uniref:hypothetical protein n=1 Tax=Tenacibaculum platacis TaxID=3137852 RepID=UPI0031FA6120